MGTRSSYEPGTFCWVELSTSDAAGAKEFYSAVFGWDYEDGDMPGGMTYTMVKQGGTDVAGLMQSDEAPPHWNSYIAVESADDVAKQAADAGGRVFVEPMNVGDSGRMAVLQDPSGALVSVWEAGEHPGAGLVNAHGALSWNDLQTHDVAKAVDFYTGVFGWEVAAVGEDADSERMVVRVGERLNGGIAKLPEAAGEGTPPHWLAYFAVDDMQAALEAAESAGGDKLFGPLDIPAGSLAIMADPQGAAFALFSGELD